MNALPVTLPAGQQFFETLIKLGKAGQWAPEHMLELIFGECDGYSVKNRFGFSGFTQIGGSELAALGYRGVPFETAPAHVQMVTSAKYFDYWRKRSGLKRWESSAQLWACNIAPAHLGRADEVVFDEAVNGPQYRANAWLDMAGKPGRPGRGDRVITLRDLEAAMETVIARNRVRYDQALHSLNAVKMQQALRIEPTGPVPDMRDTWDGGIRFELPDWPGGSTS